MVPPPPPLLLLDPQAGRRVRLASTVPNKKKANTFRRRESAAPNHEPKPSRASPGRGSHRAYCKIELRSIAAEAPTVVKVNVALPPALVAATGLVFPKEHAGAGLTTGATLHESVTLPE